MYEVFYNLKAEPFRLSPDHKFCYEHKGYARARAYMAYAFMRAEGFVMITGRPGTGKTTLIGELVESLSRDNVSTANLVCTQLEADDLLKTVAYNFGIDAQGADKAELLRRLEVLFNRWHRERRRALLIVDEAQDLSVSAMEELRLLTNIQLSGQPLLQIFLLGQPELRELVLSPPMEQVHQRIVAASHLEGLEVDEVEAYVMHRLQKVGWAGDPTMSKALFPLLHKYSEGIPRRINLICSRLFLHGGVEQRHAIEVKDLRIVIDELQSESLAAGAVISEDDFEAVEEQEWVETPPSGEEGKPQSGEEDKPPSGVRLRAVSGAPSSDNPDTPDSGGKKKEAAAKTQIEVVTATADQPAVADLSEPEPAPVPASEPSRAATARINPINVTPGATDAGDAAPAETTVAKPSPGTAPPSDKAPLEKTPQVETAINTDLPVATRAAATPTQAAFGQQTPQPLADEPPRRETPVVRREGPAQRPGRGAPPPGRANGLRSGAVDRTAPDTGRRAQGSRPPAANPRSGRGRYIAGALVGLALLALLAALAWVFVVPLVQDGERPWLDVPAREVEAAPAQQGAGVVGSHGDESPVAEVSPGSYAGPSAEPLFEPDLGSNVAPEKETLVAASEPGEQVQLPAGDTSEGEVLAEIPQEGQAYLDGAADTDSPEPGTALDSGREFNSGETLEGESSAPVLAEPDAPTTGAESQTEIAQVATQSASAGGDLTLLVGFAFDSVSLSDAALDVLDEAARHLNRNLGSRALVTGFADRTGNAIYNLDLSWDRARVVEEYLVAAGVERARLSVEGKGATENSGSGAASQDTTDRERFRIVQITIQRPPER